MDKEIGLQLAEFAVVTKYKDIPKEIIDFAKGLNLKTVAGMAVGSRRVSGRKMATLIRDRKMPEEAGIIASNFKTSSWDAALLQGFYAHASELEDDRMGASLDYAGFSWDITVIPVVVSLTQKLRLSGEAFLEALVVGLEVHVRTCLFHNSLLEVGFLAGPMGPAAAAAKVWGLSVKETVAALGLAMSGSPLSTPNIGTDGHYFESALHCLQGVMAAEMAKSDLAGNPNVARYLSKLLGKDRVAPEAITADLGRRWRLTEIGIKKYPCCFYTQRQIDALLELRKAHNLSYDEVESIEVHGGLMDKTTNRPEPKTEEDVEFSIQHLLGAAMLYGDVGAEHIAEKTINNSRMREARLKVKQVIHYDWSKEPNQAPALVIIKTKDGRQFSKERMHLIGSPSEPLTMEQFRGLYSKYTRDIFSEKDISMTADALLNLETLSEDDVQKLMDVLTFGSKN